MFVKPLQEVSVTWTAACSLAYLSACRHRDAALTTYISGIRSIRRRKLLHQLPPPPRGSPPYPYPDPLGKYVCRTDHGREVQKDRSPTPGKDLWRG